MSDILVTSPYRPFTLPNQFKAVFNGYIYCGTVDAVDPSVSQVQVYLVNESGDKVPVAQPLRTNAGGFLVYNGQPAKFVTDSNHSLLVQDSFHVQVWYAPDVADIDPSSAIVAVLDILAGDDGSSLMGFIQAGDGSVHRTAQDKMRDEVHVRDYTGATAAQQIQNAIDHCELNGIKKLKISGSFTLAPEFSYVAAGVTERCAVKLRPGVTIDATEAEFHYTGSAADVVLNQFHFFSNDPAAPNANNIGFIGGHFVNDGTVGAYVNGVTIFAGDDTRPMPYADNLDIHGQSGVNIRALVKIHSDRASGNLPITNLSVKSIRNKSCQSSTVYLVGVRNFEVGDILCDGSTFDVVNIFSADTGNIGMIGGTDITENLVLFDASQPNYAIKNITVSKAASKTGKITIATRAANTKSISDITLDDIHIPTILLDNSAGGGAVTDINVTATITPDGKSRGLYVNKCDDVALDVKVHGDPTLEGVGITNAKRVTGALKVRMPNTTLACVVLDRAAGAGLKVDATGGKVALFLRGAAGSMGGAKVSLYASGQATHAVDYDGSTSASHRVNVSGYYSDQALSYGDVAGSLIDLQDGNGLDLTIVANAVAVASKSHVITGGGVLNSITTGLRGQRVTLFAVAGSSFTVNNATGGGNIRTKTAAAVTVSDVIPITLQFFNGKWAQV